MIHLTRDMAGLIAQVFPTLLIALALEGRLRFYAKSRWGKRLAGTLHFIRALTVGLAVITSFWCVLFIGTSPSMQSPPWLDFLVTVSMLLLFVSLMTAAGFLIGQQSAEDNAD